MSTAIKSKYMNSSQGEKYEQKWWEMVQVTVPIFIYFDEI